jgi:uncharacterized membrane protein YfcA
MGDMSLYALLAGAAFLLAATKTSFPSAGILVVLLLATQLEARTALGILMPIYVFADVAALFFYRDRVRLGIALRLMPGALVGMAIAVLVGAGLSAGIFNRILGAVILATVTLTVVIGDRSSDIAERLPRWTVPLIGVVAGFATMIGNSSGPIVSIYLILGGLAKQAFVGTSSVFYLLVNLTKLPLHLWVWESVTPEMFLWSVKVLPAAIAGAFLGRWVLPRVPAKAFRITVLVLAALAALRLIIAPGA